MGGRCETPTRRSSPRSLSAPVRDHHRWAREEVGGASFGDLRRTHRAVTLFAALAAHVAGTITGAFRNAAQRHAAYDFLGSAKVTLDALAKAIWTACARRCRSSRWVYVPIDASSIAVHDPHRTRGTGAVGSHTLGARGWIVMTAIAVNPLGVVLGVCGQMFWARASHRIKDSRAKRPFRQKESHHWLLVAQQVIEVFQDHAKGCVPWFQIDRGGDVGDVLLKAVKRGWRITVRAAQNRRLLPATPVRYLWDHLLKTRVLGSYKLEIPPRGDRAARVARMNVRACTVTLRLKDRKTDKIRSVTLGAVHVRETRCAKGETPIEWTLFTTAPVTCFEEARQVIDGYTHRWKIELFHRLWKSGRCQVEETHLHTSDRIQKWATILSSVAMRALQLTQQARVEPESPADTMLRRSEIDTIILLRKPKGYKRGDTPSLGLAVRWLAEIGGFTNKSKKTPPGMIVVARGLDNIALAVQLLEGIESSENKALREK